MTRYSKQIPGDDGNYKLSARFDKNGSYLGISQWKPDGLERVLLSAAQTRELLKFLGAKRVRKPSKQETRR